MIDLVFWWFLFSILLQTEEQPHLPKRKHTPFESSRCGNKLVSNLGWSPTNLMGDMPEEML